MTDEPFYSPNKAKAPVRVPRPGEPLWFLRQDGVAREAELLDHLAESGVGGILPSCGECSVESVENPNMSQTSDIAICQYGDGRVVSLYRMNLAETNNALEALDR